MNTKQAIAELREACSPYTAYLGQGQILGKKAEAVIALLEHRIRAIERCRIVVHASKEETLEEAIARRANEKERLLDELEQLKRERDALLKGARLFVAWCKTHDGEGIVYTEIIKVIHDAVELVETGSTGPETKTNP